MRREEIDRDPELEEILEEMSQRIAQGGHDDNSEDDAVELITEGERLDQIVCKYPVVIAMFTSPTCAACAIYKPIFYEFAKKARRMYGDRVKFVEVDVYYAYEKAMELGIMGTPTTIIFRNCEVVDGFVGAVDEYSLEEILRPYLEEARKT